MKRRVVRISILGYVVTTLPLVVLLAWNAHVRSVVFNITSHYKSKAAGIDTAFVGDSITAGGGVWSLRISWMPFDAMTFANNGYTIRQVRHEAARAASYRPDTICVLAGTNDVHHPRFDLEFSAGQYRQMLSEIEATGARCVVTLVPYQAGDSVKDRIDLLNSRISKIALENGCDIVDLNPIIAPSGILLDEYTTDGVHFTEAAYDVWSELLMEALSA